VVAKAAQRRQDREMMHLLKLLLQAAGKRGVPQGGGIFPVVQKSVPQRGRSPVGAGSGEDTDRPTDRSRVGQVCR
jgi:hypothetical protein